MCCTYFYLCWKQMRLKEGRTWKYAVTYQHRTYHGLRHLFDGQQQVNVSVITIFFRLKNYNLRFFLLLFASQYVCLTIFHGAQKRRSQTDSSHEVITGCCIHGVLVTNKLKQYVCRLQLREEIPRRSRRPIGPRVKLNWWSREVYTIWWPPWKSVG